MSSNRHSLQITLIQRHESNGHTQHIVKSGGPDGHQTCIDKRDEIDRNKYF